MSATPPGWYDDGRGAQRWWDGIRWTEHVQPIAAPAQVQPFAESGPTPATGPDAVTAVLPDPQQHDPYYGAGLPVPPPQKKSKLWILWVVLGVVVLAFVIGAIVIIPLLIGGFLGAAGGSSSGTGTETGTPDEQAAVAAVQLWDDAWSNVDCDAFFQATTEELRTEIELADCSTFEEQAQNFTDSTDDYQLEVQDVTHDGDTIVITTTETYQNLVDADTGETLDSPEAIEEQWEYHVIDTGGQWAIDDAFTQ
jgi:hypothetical protein